MRLFLAVSAAFALAACDSAAVNESAEPPPAQHPPYFRRARFLPLKMWNRVAPPATKKT